MRGLSRRKPKFQKKSTKKVATKKKIEEANVIEKHLPKIVFVDFLQETWKSGGELLKMRLLDSHLLDTFGSKSIARHEIDKLLESS